MRVLILGSGGREHALVDAILRDKGTLIYCAPGNAGISKQAECVNIKPDNITSLLRFANDNKIDLTIVGPEQPLAAGIVDAFENRGRKIFGPRRLAARLETSKAFAKEFMRRWKIPTAEFMTFTIKEVDKLRKYLETARYPLVLKADGLAAGKGVSIVQSREDSETELDKFFIKKVFGESGERIVVEEFMSGTEASVFAITDGKDYVVLPPAQDHKRVGDNDVGKNTGGMGAFAPTPFVSDSEMEKVKSEIIERVIEGTNAEGYPFRGCLYCGLMLTEEGPKVVEFNARFGDPETQAVLQLVDSSILGLLQTAADKKIGSYKLALNNAAAVCVIAASKGYPDHYEKGKEITGLEDNFPDTKVFHSGSTLKEGRTMTDGGRVLGITGIDKGGELKRASEAAYARIEQLHFDGMFYRHDIGKKAIDFEMKKGSNI
ncbi:MAG: phosphoribosylamine--glycine ligase [Bacteroidetes bacterium]|nr:phosphoribosylamine--glycine ligase [Bacteroidota bacterium]